MEKTKEILLRTRIIKIYHFANAVLNDKENTDTNASVMCNEIIKYSSECIQALNEIIDNNTDNKCKWSPREKG